MNLDVTSSISSKHARLIFQNIVVEQFIASRQQLSKTSPSSHVI